MNPLSLFCDLQEMRLRASLARSVSISAKAYREVPDATPAPQTRRPGKCHQCRHDALPGRSRCADCLRRKRERHAAKSPERTLRYFRQAPEAQASAEGR